MYPDPRYPPPPHAHAPAPQVTPAPAPTRVTPGNAGCAFVLAVGFTLGLVLGAAVYKLSDGVRAPLDEVMRESFDPM